MIETIDQAIAHMQEQGYFIRSASAAEKRDEARISKGQKRRKHRDFYSERIRQDFRKACFVVFFKGYCLGIYSSRGLMDFARHCNDKGDRENLKNYSRHHRKEIDREIIRDMVDL